jgi:hypothetical protein
VSGVTDRDPASDLLGRLIGTAVRGCILLLALPLVIPALASRLFGNFAATKTRFWVVWKWQWLANTAGVLVVLMLLTFEAGLIAHWIRTGQSQTLLSHPHWKRLALDAIIPWLIVNIFSGAFLLPIAWSLRRRRTAELVRNRRISDVVRQERIETARKRASDRTAAERIGVKVDARTGQVLETSTRALTVPLLLAGKLQAFGLASRATVTSLVDRLHDVRRVRDWIDPTGQRVILPPSASAVRALIIAESGAGKTVLLNGLVLCALEYGWPVFVIDAKGDPEDADYLMRVARGYGRTVANGGVWNLFNGTADQVTSKLMRLMPDADGANQHYLDEIRGALQAVQHASSLTSVDDLRIRLTSPGPFVRDQYDLAMINQPVDRLGTTAGTRALHSLLSALRPLDPWIGEDGWSFTQPLADVTVVPLSPVDEAQARLGDLLMLDLRHFLASRLVRRDKTPVLVLVDEFAQLVSGNQDPGDTAGSLFETARSAGVGLVLATQSPAGLSNDAVRRRRALTSGAALIFGRSKDPEDVVKYAGTAMRMEASASAFGEELGSGRAQHAFVIPPQDVREAADGAFWIVQSGAIASFRALPQRAAPAESEQG